MNLNFEYALGLNFGVFSFIDLLLVETFFPLLLQLYYQFFRDLKAGQYLGILRFGNSYEPPVLLLEY